MRLAVIGGGAAGFFLAVNAAQSAPGLEVVVFEQRARVLSKLEASGGGRCNCTNTFVGVKDLKTVYPRGAGLIKRQFKRFGPRDAFAWFESRGVPLAIADDQRVFPRAQDSRAISGCLKAEADRLGVRVRTGCRIDRPEALLRDRGGDFDFVAVTIGGTPGGQGCVPSLFAFKLAGGAHVGLAGVSAPEVVASVSGTKLSARGALLVTHDGFSGPAILKLSSYAARELAGCAYRFDLKVNWAGGRNYDEVSASLRDLARTHARKAVSNVAPFGLSGRLWSHVVLRAAGRGEAPVGGKRCADLSRRDFARLTEALTGDTYAVSGRVSHKDEFVTCGGVPLDAIDKATMESKQTPGLFYAGEVLDIDGITGGFNFQAAWTTAYAAAAAIAQRAGS